jgi:hypothetical protein
MNCLYSVETICLRPKAGLLSSTVTVRVPPPELWHVLPLSLKRVSLAWTVVKSEMATVAMSASPTGRIFVPWIKLV